MQNLPPYIYHDLGKDPKIIKPTVHDFNNLSFHPLKSATIHLFPDHPKNCQSNEIYKLFFYICLPNPIFSSLIEPIITQLIPNNPYIIIHKLETTEHHNRMWLHDSAAFLQKITSIYHNSSPPHQLVDSQNIFSTSLPSKNNNSWWCLWLPNL